jgi:hypothetical protein
MTAQFDWHWGSILWYRCRREDARPVLAAGIDTQASNSPFQGGRHSLGDEDREAGNEKHGRQAPGTKIVATAFHDP